MKIKTLLVAGLLCLFPLVARADLVWVEGLNKAADRATLILELEPGSSEGTLRVVVRFAGRDGMIAVLEIPRFRNAEERRNGIENILRALNDPERVYITLGEVVRDAGLESVSPRK